MCVACGRLCSSLVVVVLFVLAGLPRAARAEEGSGSLTGQVVDEDGVAVVGVKVTARNVPMGGERSVYTGAAGQFEFAALSPGIYDVSAESAGFVTEVRHGITVPAAAPLGITMRSLTLQELMNIPVETASKFSQPTSEAPSVVEVVTRKQIDLYGWVSLNDVLFKQPGFGPAQDFDRRTVSARGFWESWLNNHLLLLVDGIPMNETAYGSALTSEVTPLFMVKEVEILRGPGSALYGSSATNGVITVDTLSADDLNDRVEAHVRLGQAGTWLYDWVGGIKTDGPFSVVVGYARGWTDGNEVMNYDGSGRGVDAGGAGSLQQFQTNDHRGNSYAWLKLEGQEALKGLTIQLHDQSWRFQTGYGWAWWIPDQREQQDEERRAVFVSYKSSKKGRLQQEYAVRWQVHDFNWHTRFYPEGAFDGDFPSGVWEYVDSSVQDLFARAQLSWTLRRNSNLLFGVEADGVLYTRDDAHYANFDPDTGTANPDGTFRSLGPWMDTVRNHPSVNLAPYAQFSSGELLGNKVKVTAGARYDQTRLVIDPDVAFLYLGSGRFNETRTFSQLNPRLAVVVLPRENLSIKAMAGTAFRAPTFAEIGGAHTLELGADPVKLGPETVRTVELATDWRIEKWLDWRTNVFQTTYADFIASSSANLNFASNVFTLKNRGLETELLLSHSGVTGFWNYAYAKRVDETIHDPLVAPSRSLTWQPSHRVNVGAAYTRRGVSLSLSGHYEGSVRRRSSEVGSQALIYGASRTIDLDQYRPRELESWVTLDGKATYTFRHGGHAWRLFVGGTNLAGTRKNVLAKIGPFPFDFPQEGRRLYAGLMLE